jgi:hypothetical protein
MRVSLPFLARQPESRACQDIWELPCRRPLAPQIRKLPQAIPWLAERINLTLNPDQRGFDVPPQAALFED